MVRFPLPIWIAVPHNALSGCGERAARPAHPPVTYRNPMPKSTPEERKQNRMRKHLCPVPGCPGWARTPYNMRVHFSRRHPQDTIIIPEESSVPLERCPKCRMQVGSLNRLRVGELHDREESHPQGGRP